MQSLLTQFDAYRASKSLGDTNPNAARDFYSGFGSQWGGNTDSETGLTLMGHRYYDPNEGRFITRDPLGLDGGFNLYRYADDNPIGEDDPMGLNPVSDFYMGGMGGFSDLVDRFLMNGSVGNLGTVAGEHDSGCASDLDLAKAGLNVAGNAAMLVLPGGEEAEAGVKGARLAEEGAAQAEKEFAETCGRPGGCFLVGTPLRLIDGSSEAIETVRQGSAVASRPDKAGNTDTGNTPADQKLALSSRTDRARVDMTTARTVPTVLTVTVGNAQAGPSRDAVTCTPEHPLFVLGKGWTAADVLRAGDRIATRCGVPLVVQSVVWHQSVFKPSQPGVTRGTKEAHSGSD